MNAMNVGKHSRVQQVFGCIKRSTQMQDLSVNFVTKHSHRRGTGESMLANI